MFLSKNEIVLCYEPDPTKAKVLYDSKIMEVRIRKDTRGRRTVEYLIHFQGWSSNWDRYVCQEFVLKDTEENRALQNRLNEEAQILKQSLKKKKKRTLAEAIKDIRQERKRLSAATPDRQEDESSKSSSFTDADLETSEEEDENEENEEDEDDDETFPLVIPEDIKRRLEQDCHMITQEIRLARVPANPCVAKIFEDYVKYFGLKELLEWAERVKWESTQRSQQASTTVVAPPPPPIVVPQMPVSPSATPNAKLPTVVPTTTVKEEPKRDELKIVIQRINFVKEIVDGLRLMFDFLVGRILLYKQEVKQFTKSKEFVLTPSVDVPNSILSPLITKCKSEFQEDVEIEKDEPPTKRMTRTSKALAKRDFDSGTDEMPEVIPSSSRGRMSSSEASTSSGTREKRCPSPDSKRRAQEYTKDLLNWKLLPTEEYDVSSPHPSLIYGIIHIMRLFVKMPEILSKTTIPRRRLRILVGHINLLLAFVAKYDGLLEKRSLYYRRDEENY